MFFGPLLHPKEEVLHSLFYAFSVSLPHCNLSLRHLVHDKALHQDFRHENYGDPGTPCSLHGWEKHSFSICADSWRATDQFFPGKYKLLINVPISIASAMAASCVPTLTMSFAQKDMKKVREQINSAMRFIMVISFPCAIGLAVLGEPICRLLFPGTAQTAPMAGTMMWVGAMAVVFYAMSTLSNGLLQGIDRLKIPVINAAVSLVAHVIVLIILMLFFRMNIYAVIIANMFFAFLMCIMNALAIRKYSGYHQEIPGTINVL